MNEGKIRLLLFNLTTDADDSNLGFTTDWINALAEKCDYIDVITMRAGRLAVADNVRVYSVGKEKGYGEARRTLAFYRILIRLLRDRCYNVCFAHMMPLFALMGTPLLKLWRVPIVLWYAHKAVSFKLRLVEKVVWRVVTSSPESFRLSSRKTRVIGQGVDTDLFRPASARQSDDPSFIVISAGRIAPVKRLEILIEAARSLYHDRNMRRLQVRIIGEAWPGDAEYARRLRDMVAALNLQDVVEFAGAIRHEQVAQNYQKADVMVNTSQTGSMDKAVLEAMACGLPVVTSNEAFRTLLAPWGDLLYMPPDSPDKLTASLFQLKDRSTDERAALGRDLREIVVREHSLEQLIMKLMNVLKTGEPS